MMRSRFIQHFIQRGALLAALIGSSAAVVVAQSAEDLRMTVGKSVVIDYPSDIRQISTSNPEILDARDSATPP
jgi:Flp pilus assembly secretin CpaC